MSEIRKIAGNAPLNKESVLDELFKNMPEDQIQAIHCNDDCGKWRYPRRVSSTLIL